MKKIFAPLILIALTPIFFITSCGHSSASRSDRVYRGEAAAKHAARYGQPKKKVFVYPFFNDTPYSPQEIVGSADELGHLAADELSREIRVSEGAIVPEDLQANSTSKDFYSGNKIRLNPLIREGKRLGLSILIVGKIARIVYRKKGDEVGLLRRKKFIAAVDMEMRVFSVSDSKEILFDQKTCDSESSQVDLFGNTDADSKSQRLELVRSAMRECVHAFSMNVAKLLDKINWEGRVAKVSAGGRIYINAGRASGLSIGDILKVLTPGEHIYDPNTNAYVGRSQGQVKGTLEVVGYVGADGSVTTLQSGGNIFENDIVELY